MENYFADLYEIDVSSKVEEKNGLSYLSWAWAWGELKKRHPDSSYQIYEDANGRPYHNDGRTAWVKVGVTVNGIEHIEYLPIMDYRNQSIPLESVKSTDVNKSIQRGLTKAIARHGLGRYIYAGEDLPEGKKPIPLTPEHAKKITDLAKARFGKIAGMAFKRLTGVSDLTEVSDDQFETLMEKIKNAEVTE